MAHTLAGTSVQNILHWSQVGMLTVVSAKGLCAFCPEQSEDVLWTAQALFHIYSKREYDLVNAASTVNLI